MNKANLSGVQHGRRWSMHDVHPFHPALAESTDALMQMEHDLPQRRGACWTKRTMRMQDYGLEAGGINEINPCYRKKP